MCVRVCVCVCVCMCVCVPIVAKIPRNCFVLQDVTIDTKITNIDPLICKKTIHFHYPETLLLIMRGMEQIGLCISAEYYCMMLPYMAVGSIG